MNIPRAKKYDMMWQITRVRARSIKDPETKILYVMKFLEENPNIHNASRCHNWLKMTSVAYKDQSIRDMFEEEARYIEDNIDKFSSTEDNDMTIQDASDDELLLVFKDLKKRKYGFQYKNVPKDHTEFMIELEEELNKKNLI